MLAVIRRFSKSELFDDSCTFGPMKISHKIALVVVSVFIGSMQSCKDDKVTETTQPAEIKVETIAYKTFAKENIA
ncbi:MAG: hypothetical protein ACI9JN_002682, partial [Bacteroidia bacterium]